MSAEDVYTVLCEKIAANVARQYPNLPYSKRNEKILKDYVAEQIQFLIDIVEPRLKPAVRNLFGDLEARIIFSEETEQMVVQLVKKEK